LQGDAMRSDEIEELTRLREQVIELTDRVDNLCAWIDYIGDFLEDYTNPLSGSRHMPGGGYRYGKRFYKVPRPEEAENVLREIEITQRALFKEMLTEWLDELGTLKPTHRQFHEFVDNKCKHYRENPEEYRDFCIPRRNLGERMKLHHSRLKQNTDHLVHTGEIIEYGKIGTLIRFGLSFESFGFRNNIMTVFHPWVIEDTEDGEQLFNLEGLVS
jgi:hypothetical protein